MSFSYKNVQGDASSIPLELDNVVSHDREDRISDVIELAVDDIAHSLGGYISIDVRGHLNPAAGETGDEISIHVVSLPYPADFVPASPVPTEPEFTPVEEITTQSGDVVAGTMETVEDPNIGRTDEIVRSPAQNFSSTLDDINAAEKAVTDGETRPADEVLQEINSSPEENQAVTSVEEGTVAQTPPATDDIPF